MMGGRLRACLVLATKECGESVSALIAALYGGNLRLKNAKPHRNRKGFAETVVWIPNSVFDEQIFHHEAVLLHVRCAFD